MSAPNFYTKNASKVFIVEAEEEYDIDDTKENIASELAANGYTEVSIYGGDSSYPGEYFISKELTFWNVWRITIYACIRSGYFSDANLDWDVNVIKDRDEDYEECNLGDITLPKTVQRAVDVEIRRLEKVFAMYSTPAVCVGIFSNGEAVYAKL